MKLKVHQVAKEFQTARGRVQAIQNIDFETRESEFFVLLGPSGCGKSTLLNLIAGLEKLTSGEIWFGEKCVASTERNIHLPPKERNVAMVFQSYALYPHLNVFENIAFPLKIAAEQQDRVQESVRKVSEMLGITNLLRSKPGELSGGQRQRVAIARAIVRHPSIFLLDEPLSNLDAGLRASTRAELKNLQKKLNITTIYVTHDQVEAMSLGHRIALLREGTVEQIGSPKELYQKPANAFVAGHIGSPPMNLLHCSLYREGDENGIWIGKQKIKFPSAKLNVLDKLKSADLLVGIRPEHIKIGKGVYGECGLRTELKATEILGKEILLCTSVEKQELFILTTEDRFFAAEPGTLLDVAFGFERLFFFEKDGRREAVPLLRF